MSPGKKLKVSAFACPQRATSISLKFLSKSKFGVIQNTRIFWSLNHLHQLKCHNLKRILHFNRSGIQTCVVLVFA